MGLQLLVRSEGFNVHPARGFCFGPEVYIHDGDVRSGLFFLSWGFGW